VSIHKRWCLPLAMDTLLNDMRSYTQAPLQTAGLLACLLLTACATTPPQEESTPIAIAAAEYSALVSSLPGAYSNFDQSRGSDGRVPVIDVVVRHLTDGQRSAFLFSGQYRESGERRHQVYLVSPAGSEDVLELRFAPVTEDILALPLPDILTAAEQRTQPGCGILLAPTSNGLVGESRADICRFNHPTAGDVGLTREMSFGRGNLVIAERLTNSSGQAINEDAILHLRQHQTWTGWAGIHVDPDAAADDTAAWRLATPFSLMDDGRVVPLVDAAGDTTQYGLQLAYLSWHADKPPFLRLALLELESGKMLAYTWTVPGSAQLGMNLEWFQAGLERQTP
jgi:hypothetical protein